MHESEGVRTGWALSGGVLLTDIFGSCPEASFYCNLAVSNRFRHLNFGPLIHFPFPPSLCNIIWNSKNMSPVTTGPIALSSVGVCCKRFFGGFFFIAFAFCQFLLSLQAKMKSFDAVRHGGSTPMAGPGAARNSRSLFFPLVVVAFYLCNWKTYIFILRAPNLKHPFADFLAGTH